MGRSRVGSTGKDKHRGSRRGKGKGKKEGWYGGIDAEVWCKGKGKGMVEEEVVCLSSGSETESESEDEIVQARNALLENLGNFISGEVSVFMKNLALKEEARGVESNLRYLAGTAKKVGYEQAESLYIKQVRDLEDLLDDEEKKRKALQEERTRMGEVVRKLVREEMEKVLGNYERRRGTEKVTEWNVRELELAAEMKRVLEKNWGGREGGIVRR